MLIDHDDKRLANGFILPFTIVLALIVLTALALWYRQVILQSHLAERLVLQRALYIECKSLLPVLIEKLHELEDDELLKAQINFLEVKNENRFRWKIDRSQLIDSKIRFKFRIMGRNIESFDLTVPYSMK